MRIENLANDLSSKLNKYFRLDIFDLYSQLNVSETLRTDVFYKLQTIPSAVGDPKNFSCIFYVPSLYENINTTNAQRLAIEKEFEKQFVLMLRELCLMPSMRPYVAEVLSESFHRPLSLHDDTNYLLDLVLNSFYDDLVSGEQKPMLNVLLAPIIAYVIEGTEMDEAELSKLGRHLNIFHMASNPKGLKAVLDKDASEKLLKLPIFLPPLKKWDIVKLKYGGASMPEEGEIAMYLGNELQDFKSMKYVSVSNPLIASHLGCAINFPITLIKNGMNLDDSYVKPFITFPNFYARPRNNDFADGLLDFRRLRVVGLGSRLDGRVTKDDAGKDIILSDDSKNLITQAIRGLLGLNDRNVAPKVLKDVSKTAKAGDVFKDTFTIDNVKVALDMIFCPSGSYVRPVHNPIYGNIERNIHISRPFLMLETKVSKWLYLALTNMDVSAGSLPSSYKDIVVSDISWLDAIDFCNRLSLLAGLDPVYQILVKSDKGTNVFDSYLLLQDVPAAKREDAGAYIFDLANGYRLPTEAEWEYAALAGTDNRFGLTEKQLKNLDAYVFLPYAKSVPKNISLVERAPNSWGIRDLLGKHSEYCSDSIGGTVYLGSESEAFNVQVDPISIAPPTIKSQPRVGKGAPNVVNHAAISVFNRSGCITTKAFSFNSFRICRSFV